MADSNTILPASLQQYSLQQSETTKEKESLDQADFLNLMLTQLQNQDPTNPMESADFMSQMAQFSTVNGITELNTSFATLSGSLQSNQALQASTMVGSTVLVPSEIAQLNAGSQVNGKIFLESSTGNLSLNILDDAGQSVKQIYMGTQEAGLVDFNWNGLDEDGQTLPAGKYTIQAKSIDDGESVAQTVLVNSKVESVSLITGSDPLLNLNGLGAYSMSDVLEIM